MIFAISVHHKRRKSERFQPSLRDSEVAALALFPSSELLGYSQLPLTEHLSDSVSRRDKAKIAQRFQRCEWKLLAAPKSRKGRLKSLKNRVLLPLLLCTEFETFTFSVLLTH